MAQQAVRCRCAVAGLPFGNLVFELTEQGATDLKIMEGISVEQEQWQQIEKLFYEAMELPSEEREAFLRQACAGDEELHREVQALLAANQDAQSFLDAPVPMPPHSGTFSPTLIMPHPAAKTGATVESGSRIGAYRLICEIGRGGMGAVWLAERADGQFYQQVAIKLLHAGSENEEVIRRFRHERQILASLDHPNIARLLDGGTTEDGRPYFVMEYIEGLPIDEYCRQHQLSVDDRLRMFRRVCAAVHYAHQNLVIHRDLKPSNIAVTEDGTPKLLDFGIAKLIQPDLSRSYDTLSGVTPMTPAYASPEQVRGEKLTTASDVYSLGVVLYELLTGRSPYRLKAQSFGELMRAVIEQEPERPSTAITRADETPPTNPITIEPTEKLRRRLSGDIDSIVLMALRKEAPARYGSVEQFSEDLRRYLEGLPTVARRGTLGYRAAKYIRRNKVSVAAAALILVSLLGGIGATLRQARIAKAAQLQAETEKSEAQLQRTRAEAALLTAEERRGQAETARAEANQQRDEADAQRNYAEGQQLRAESQEMSNRRLLYASQMALAQSAWNDSNVGLVRDLLNAHIPKPGEMDFRGFEWRYLWQLSHSELASFQHEGLIASIAVTPEGKKLATISGSPGKRMGLKLWNITTAREQYSVFDEKVITTTRVSSLVIFPDGHRIATHGNKAIGLWDTETGRLLASFETHNPSLRCMTLSPDGKVLATWGDDGQITMVDASTGKELLVFKAHNPGAVGRLAFSPSGESLLTVGLDRNCKLWNVHTGKELFSISKNNFFLSAIAWAPTGRLFALGLGSSEVVIVDGLTGNELRTVKIQGGVASLAFSPNGKILAVGGADRQIRLVNTEKWVEQSAIKGHGHLVQSLSFTPDGQKLLSGSADGTVKLWEVGKREERILYCTKAYASNAAFSHDSKRLLTGSNDHNLRIWDTSNGDLLHTLNDHQQDENQNIYPFFLSLSADGKKAATGGIGGIRIWDITAGKQLLKISFPLGYATTLSPDGRFVTSIGPWGIKVWDATTGRELESFGEYLKHVNAMLFLPDNRTLVTAYDDLIFWDTATQKELKKIPFKNTYAFSLALSPDGNTLAAGLADSTVRLLDAWSGLEKMVLKGHGAAVSGVAFSPDGRRLATAGREPFVRVWDLTTGQGLLVFNDFGEFSGIAFSPDGRKLAAATTTGYVRVWTDGDPSTLKAGRCP